jgi:TRAP-type uncharacterized transport system substrate-binding protein
MQFRKSILATSVSALAAIGVMAGAAQARDEVRVPTLTAPFGAGIMEQIVIFERLIAKRHPWVRLVAQESPGFVYNIREMENPKRHKTTTFWSSTGGLWAAETAQKGFFPKPIPRDDFRWIVTRSSNCFFFATFDPTIKTIKDFSGKKIALGRRSQTHWGLFTNKAIEVGYGVKDAKLEYLGNNVGISALLDGRVDVAAMGATMTADQKVVFPSGTVRKIAATGRKYYNIPIPRAAVEKINKDLKAPFVSHRLAPNKLPNQPAELECLGDYVFQASHKTFPDDVAHALTTVFLEIDTEAGKYLGGGKLYRRASMCVVPAGVKPHPASIKACRDFGIEPTILK